MREKESDKGREKREKKLVKEGRAQAFDGWVVRGRAEEEKVEQ